MKYFQGGRIRTVYETGFSGFVLHRELVKQGINNIVVHAAGVEVAVNNRVKTDKRDAQKLAALLEAGRLKGIGIPTHTQEQRRILTRTREQLVSGRRAAEAGTQSRRSFAERSGVKNKISNVLSSNGTD